MLRSLGFSLRSNDDRFQFSIFLLPGYYFCFSLDSLFASVQNPKFSSTGFFIEAHESAEAPIKRVQSRIVGLWLLVDDPGNEYESKVSKIDLVISRRAYI
jgi:hypothetical protein